MKPRRYSLPSERPVIGTVETSFSRTGYLLPAVLSLPPVVGYFWRGRVFGDWGWGLVGLVLSAGFAWVVWRGLLERTTESNSSIYQRYQRPARYWLVISVWFAAYLVSVAAFFVAHTPSNAPIHR